MPIIRRLFVVSLALVFSAIEGVPLRAAPVPIATHPVLAGPGGVRWTVSNDGGTGTGQPFGACADQPGLTVRDAQFDDSHGDAFDDGYTIWVGDQIVVAPETVDVTDGTLTAGPVRLSGLDVTVQYRAVAASPTLRVLVSLANPTATAISTTFRVLTNLGSNAATQIVASASEVWAVTADSATDPVGDAVNTAVINGTRNPEAHDFGYPAKAVGVDSSTFVCDGDEGWALGDEQLVVPAGETVRFLFFHQVHGDLATAVPSAHAFDTPLQRGAALVADLSDTELLWTLNWAFWPAVTLETGDVQWHFANAAGSADRTIGGECGYGPGFALGDAEMRLGNVTRGDPFDYGVQLWVDDRPFVAPFEPVVGSRSLIVGPATMSNLEVRVRHDALPDTSLLRTVYQFTNSTAADVTASVDMTTNIGSDAKTGVRATSSGDALFGTDDRWLVTSDHANTPGDLVNLHVVSGPSPVGLAPSPLRDVATECAGAQGVRATFPLTVPAGATRTLLFFNGVYATNEEAIAAGPTFDTTPTAPALLVSDLPRDVLATTVNWSFCSVDAAVCDDGDACTVDACEANGACANTRLPRAATLPSIDCRLRDLATDVTAALPESAARASLLDRLARARQAVADALGDDARAARQARRLVTTSLRAFSRRLGKAPFRKTLDASRRRAFRAVALEAAADLRGAGSNGIVTARR